MPNFMWLFLSFFFLSFFFVPLWHFGQSRDFGDSYFSAPAADIDCQQDVSFLLFISSSLSDVAECKSGFSPRGGGVRGGGGAEGERRW